ncbi:MAG: DNA-3-methyladenine glycosylase family protein [Acidimicrobiales bacterium]
MASDGSSTTAPRPGYRRGPNPAVDHLRRADPVLARVIAAHPDFDPRAWLAELPPLDAFGALVFQVIGQQLSVIATRRILERIQDSFGGRLPTPADLLDTDPDRLHQAGLSRRKVDTLRAVARGFADGSLYTDDLAQLSDEDVEARLTAIPGIGPWTVHGFLIIALDRPDVVLPGDLALRKVIQQTYQLDRLPTQDDVLRIAKPWRPYRSLATAYLFQAEFDPPRRGDDDSAPHTPADSPRRGT